MFNSGLQLEFFKTGLYTELDFKISSMLPWRSYIYERGMTNFQTWFGMK